MIGASNRPKAWDSNYVSWAQNADPETTMTFTWAERAYLIGSWLELASPTMKLGTAGKAANAADEVIDVQKRADEIHSALPAATQSRTTTAVVVADDGTVIVSSSEKYLRKSQRAVLKDGEVHATGIGHAEETVLNTAQSMNKNLKEVGASRPVCLDCENVLTKNNVVIKSAKSGKVSRKRRVSSLRGYPVNKRTKQMIDEILNNREVLFNRLDRNLGRLISFYFARRLSRTSNNFWINLSVELFNEVESIFEKVKLLIINGSFDEESVIEDIVRLESYNDGSLYSIIAMDSLALLKTIVNSYVDKIKLSDTLVIFIDSIDYYIQDVLHANGITPNEDQILEHKVMSKNEKWLERLIEHIESINEMKPSIFSELNENFLKDNFE